MEKTICYCNNVSESEILNAIKNGAKTLHEIKKITGAAVEKNCREKNPTGKCCIPIIQTMLRDSNAPKSTCSCCH